MVRFIASRWSGLQSLTLVLVLTLCGPALAADDAARLQQLREDIAKLQQWLNQASDEHSKLTQSMQQTDKEIGELSRKIEETERLLREEQARLKKSYQDQARLSELEAAQRIRLRQQIQAAHRLGGDGPIKMLLNQNDPDQAQRMLTWFGYFNRARVDEIQTAVAELQRLTHIAEVIAAEEQQLRQTRGLLSDQNRQLDASKKQQQQLLASLDRQMKSESERLRSKEADRKRLESLLQEVQTLVEKSAKRTNALPFKSLKGKLPKPVRGKLVRSFGRPNPEGTGTLDGWLISAPEGTDIQAVHHGRVVYSDWLRGYGLLMILDHGDGYLTLYAYNQSLLYDVGDWVSQGDRIGTVGRSGGQREAELYFEIRQKGKPVNPSSWLSR